jgi:hypothetical protein
MNAKVIFFLIISLITVSMLRGEIQCIANPTPTHVETNYIKLEIVKEIPLNIDDENFMAMPWFISTDGQGNFFVFDFMLMQIFKFDKEFRLVKVFGKAGNNPGEFGETRGGITGMSFSQKDGMLYVADIKKRKIIGFDSSGNHSKDFDLYSQARPFGSFYPVLDDEQNCFILTGLKCTIDVYNLNREDGKMQYSLMDNSECSRSLFQEVSPENERIWMGFLPGIVYYDILPGNRLAVYTSHASALTIFENEKTVKKFDIWPKKALELYRQEIEKRKADVKRNRMMVFFMFSNFFVDTDNRDSFYLECPWENGDGGMKRFLYQFDFEGRLKNVFYSPKNVCFVTRGNRLFYARSKDKIYILKDPTLPLPITRRKT